MLAALNQASQGLRAMATSAGTASNALNQLRGHVGSLRPSVDGVKNSTQQTTTALKGISTPAGQAGKGLDGVRRAADTARTAIGHVKSASATAHTGLTQIKTAADQAGKSFSGSRGGTEGFKGALDNLRTSANSAKDALRGVKTHADDVEKSVGAAGTTAQTGGGLFGKLKEGLLGAETGQKGLNTAMKANAIGLITALLAPLISKFVDTQVIADKVKQVIIDGWNAIKPAIEPAIKGLVNILTAPANAWIKVWDTVIGGLNKIHFKVPGWVPGVGGKEFGVHIPEIPTIPEMAQGGIVPATPGGLLALIGEGGQDEAVIPLNRLDSMLAHRGPVIDRSQFNELISTLRCLADQQVVVAVDGQAIARANRLGERQLARR